MILRDIKISISQLPGAFESGEMRKAHFTAKFLVCAYVYMQLALHRQPPWETWHELAPKPEKPFRDRR